MLMKTNDPSKKLRLRLRKEDLRELSGAELARAAGALQEKLKYQDCTCGTDHSNSCCGPDGTC